MAYDYDKTKGNIGADDLDSSERKKWLKTFQGSGGEIIREYDERKESSNDNSKTSSGSSGSRRTRPEKEIKMPSDIAREKARIRNEKIARKKAAEEAREAALSNFWSRLQIRFKAWSAGVSSFRSSKANFKTMKLLVDQSKRALMEFNILGTDLFLSNPAIAKKITKGLDKKDPIYMEVLERGQELYKSSIFDSFTEALSNAGQRDVELMQIRDALLELYRDLYYMYPYYNSYLKAAELAINIQEEELKSKSILASDKRKKIRKEVLFIFNNLFEKLYYLILKTDMKLYPSFSLILERAINLDPEQKIGKGNYNKSDTSDDNNSSEDGQNTETSNTENDANQAEEEDDKKDKEENKKNDEQLPKEMIYGRKLMDMYKLEMLKKKHDTNKSKIIELELNDKNYLTFLFLREFDFEYSFVLTTNKIKLRVDYSGGNKVDINQTLMDHYDSVQNTLNQMKVYNDTVFELDKIKKNPTSNYMQQTKNITSAENKRSQASRNFRLMAQESMKKIAESLLFLIQDMKSHQKTVENMNDIIKFDIRVEGKKRLSGKAVSQCIMEAYCYSYALYERLESGDLYGGILEMSEDEFKRSFGVEQWNSLNNSGSTKSTSKQETFQELEDTTVIHEIHEEDMEEIDMDSEIEDDELD